MLTFNIIYGNNNFTSQNSLLYLISDAIGRTGKGYYLSQYQSWLKKNNIPTCKWDIDRTYTDNRYSNNLVAIGTEWTPLHTDAMNDIIDNVEYTCKQKYQSAIEVPSRITGVIATNYNPSDSNTVRFGKVIFNHYSFDDHPEDHLNHTPSNYDELFTTCLLSVPNTPYKVSKVSKESLYDEMMMNSLEFAYSNNDLDKNKMYSIKSLLDVMDMDYNTSNIQKLKAFLLKNRNKGVKVYRNGNYRLSSFIDVIAINAAVNDNELEEIKEDIDTCSKEWERILSNLKSKDPNDPNNNLRYVNDAYDKELSKCSTDKEFICTAKYTKEYEEELNNCSITPDRKSEHLIPTFFVYESDTLSLNEQKDLINKSNTNHIYTSTYSGSKSIHYLVPIEQSQANEIKKDFKYYWNKAGEIVFNKEIMKSMDSNCASIGRLSRNPNAYRKIGNAKVKQDLLFKNDDVIPVNLNQIIKEHNQELKSKEEFNKVKLKINESINAQLPQLNNKKDIIYLERCYNKNHNENVGLALQVLKGVQLPKGSNLVGIASTLKAMNVDLELRKQIVTILKQQHPSNLSKDVKEYL